MMLVLYSEQSRVGPVEWLKPYTDVTIRELGKSGVKSLLAVPVRFVLWPVSSCLSSCLYFVSLTHVFFQSVY